MSRDISRSSLCITPVGKPFRVRVHVVSQLSGWLSRLLPCTPQTKRTVLCYGARHDYVLHSAPRPYVSFLSGRGDLSTCYAYLCVVEPSPKTWQMLICSTADEPGSEFRPTGMQSCEKPSTGEGKEKKNFCTAERHMALASVRKQCEYQSDTLGVEVGGLQYN